MPIRFYLHTKAYTDGRRPVYIDVRWGRGAAAGEASLSRLRTGTGQSCQPQHFTDKGRLSSAAPGYLKANRELIRLEAAAEKLIERAELDNITLTAETLLAQLKPARAEAQAKRAAKARAVPGADATVPAAVPGPMTMVELLAEWQQAFRGRRAPKTLSGPKGVVDQLELFRPGTRPDELQPDAHGRCKLFEEFCTFCLEQARNRHGEAGLLNNTLGSYVKRLRKLLKFGHFDYEWLEDDFSEEVEREPLTYDEVDQLYRHPVQEWREGGNKHAVRAGIRDVFVFICRTGPRFGSVRELGPESVVWEHLEGVGEVPILEYYAYKNRRKKTKLRVPLDEVALEIWQRYAGQLPVPSLGKFNEEIKLLCREAGLTRVVKELRGSGAAKLEERLPLWETVTAHVGRYTFITTQYKGGADLVAIQDTVGHADINTTRKYTRQFEEERLNTTLDAFQRLRDRRAT